MQSGSGVGAHGQINVSSQMTLNKNGRYMAIIISIT
jgi:hypothetical protein